MKRWSKSIGLILILGIFAVMSIGSGSSSGEQKEITTSTGTESATSSTSTSSNADEGKDEPAKIETTIEEQVIVEKDGLKITATSYEADSIWGDGIKMLIENNSDKSIGIGCSELIVNDYMISDLFSATVAAGKKANETMHLSSSQLRAAGIDNVGKVEMYLHTFDPDNYMTIENFDCITIKTSNFDTMDTTPNDAGQELFNSNGVRIIGKYVDEGSFWGAGVLLYIENNSGKNVIIQCDNMSINGFMVTPYFSSTVYDGKKAIDDITIISNDLENNGITSVDEIELVFKVIDEHSFSTIEQSEPITFSTK